MNTTNNSLDPQLPTPQPTAITRRSFIKRTAATALICVLAVNAFAEEGIASTGGESGPWTIEYQGGAPVANSAVGYRETILIGEYYLGHDFNALSMTKVYLCVDVSEAEKKLDLGISGLPGVGIEIGDRKTAWVFTMHAWLIFRDAEYTTAHKSDKKSDMGMSQVTYFLTDPAHRPAVSSRMVTKNPAPFDLWGSPLMDSIISAVIGWQPPRPIRATIQTECSVVGLKYTVSFTDVIASQTGSFDIILKVIPVIKPKFRIPKPPLNE